MSTSPRGLATAVRQRTTRAVYVTTPLGPWRVSKRSTFGVLRDLRRTRQPLAVRSQDRADGTRVLILG